MVQRGRGWLACVGLRPGALGESELVEDLVVQLSMVFSVTKSAAASERLRAALGDEGEELRVRGRSVRRPDPPVSLRFRRKETRTSGSTAYLLRTDLREPWRRRS